MVRWMAALVLGPALALAAGEAQAQKAAVVSCLGDDWGWEGHVEACDREIAAATDGGLRAELLGARGRSLDWLGDDAAAEADFFEARDLAPGAAMPLVDLARFEEGRGDAGAALAYSEQAYAIDPGDWRVPHRLAWSLWALERYEECLPLAAEAIAAAPDAAGGHAVQGACLGGLGRHEEGLAAVERAGALGEDAAWVAENRAWQLRALDRLPEAEAAAREALGIDPSRSFALDVLIGVLVDQKRVQEAREAWWSHEYSVDMAQADLDGIRNDLAWALYLEGDHANAAPLIEGWARDNPQPATEDWPEMDTLGHVLAARGARGRAVLAFADAARLGGPAQDALYRRGLAALGIEAGDGPGGLKAALVECVALGARCRFS